jgi:hypothetical protein
LIAFALILAGLVARGIVQRRNAYQQTSAGQSVTAAGFTG